MKRKYETQETIEPKKCKTEFTLESEKVQRAIQACYEPRMDLETHVDTRLIVQQTAQRHPLFKKLFPFCKYIHVPDFLSWQGDLDQAKQWTRSLFEYTPLSSAANIRTEHVVLGFQKGIVCIFNSSTEFPLLIQNTPMMVVWWIDVIDDHDRITPCLGFQNNRILYVYRPCGYNSFPNSISFWKQFQDQIQPIQYVTFPFLQETKPFSIANPNIHGCHVKAIHSNNARRFVYMTTLGLKRAWCCLFLHAAFAFVSGTSPIQQSSSHAVPMQMTVETLFQTETNMNEWPNECLMPIIHGYTSFIIERLQQQQQLQQQEASMSYSSVKTNMIHVAIEIRPFDENKTYSPIVCNNSFPASWTLMQALKDWSKYYQWGQTCIKKHSYVLCCYKDLMIPLHPPYLDLMNFPLSVLLTSQQQEDKRVELYLIHSTQIKESFSFHVQCHTANHSLQTFHLNSLTKPALLKQVHVLTANFYSQYRWSKSQSKHQFIWVCPGMNMTWGKMISCLLKERLQNHLHQESLYRVWKTTIWIFSYH